MTVLQLATIVSATLNLIMSFMSLRCNCMICLAFYLSFDMQRLCMIELEMSISRSSAQRKRNIRQSYRSSACFSPPDWETPTPLLEEISGTAPDG